MKTSAVELSFELTGRAGAPAIVLGHSLGTDRSMWDGQRSALEASHRVLRLDLRGHGASPVPSAPYRIEDIAADVLRAADAAGLARFAYCGVSLGGIVGLFLAANHPGRIDALIAANTAAKIGTESGWNDRIAQVRASGLASMTEAVLERWLAPAFRQKDPSTVERLRRAFENTSLEGYLGCCGALATADVRAQLSEIRSPTLIVASELDVATTVADAEWAQSRIGGSRLVVLEGAAHLSNVDRASAFNDAVLAFLEGRTGPEPG